jgi:hypothetical protein
MKTGNHDQSIIFDDKKHRVRKAAQQGAADIFKYDGELLGIIDHALDQGVNRKAKTPAQPGGFAFIPILRLDQFPPSGL